MKKPVRFLCLILAALILVSTVACAGTKDKKPSSTTAADTSANPDETALTAEVEPINPELEKLDYGGRTVTILSRGSTSVFDNGEITVESLNNDPVNDAVYNRNMYVSDLLNIKIEEVSGDIDTEVRREISSGNGDYDIVAGSVFYDTPLLFDGFYYNLLDNGIDTYLDVSKPWWNQKWLAEAMLGDKLYCITGSIALSLKRLLYVTYYNKTLGESYGIGNLYEVVNAGKWTIDYENELVAGCYRDLNGNSEADEEDQYGFLINDYDCLDQYWSAFDMDFIGKDNDNWLTINLNEEKIVNAIEKVQTLLYNNTGTYLYPGMHGFQTATNMFAQGQALFASIHLQWAETEAMRNMSDDYGILPDPKYDENQKEYLTYAHDQYSVFFVPITVKDTELCGAVLEAMCYESYRSVDPAFFNVALKGRYANDQETRGMLDIIMNGLMVDAAWIYGKYLGEPAAKLFRTVVEGNDSFSANYAKFSRVLPIAMREIKEKMSNMEY